MTQTERPILFSAPMVKALLAGRKTQTRRVAKPRRFASLLARNEDGSNVWTDSYILDSGNAEWLASEAPAKAGELAYVREAFRLGLGYDGAKPSDAPEFATVFYEADGTPGPELRAGKLRPGIHMPRWCSRIERTVVRCRLERLQDISEADAIAEGITREWGIVGANCNGGVHSEEHGWIFFFDGCDDEGYGTGVDAYRALWEKLHGAGAWDSNPLVWVIEVEPA